MIFTETRLKGAFIIELERREDERGFFARSFCQREFEEYGMNPVIAQSGIALPRRKRVASDCLYARGRLSVYGKRN